MLILVTLYVLILHVLTQYEDMKKTIFIFALFLLSLEGAGQTFLQVAQKYKSRIDQLMELDKALGATISDEDAIIYNAEATLNPEQYIDFVLLRFERNDCKVQLEMASVASEAISELVAFYDSDEVENDVITDGISRFAASGKLSVERSQQLQTSFAEHMSNYIGKYGYDCEEIFLQDDKELLEDYGVR